MTLPAMPSPWVVRWLPLLSAGSTVLEVACGSGRNARHAASLGHRVDAVDRDATLLAPLAAIPGVVTWAHDLETSPWPFDGRQWDGILVTHYLHRPLFPALLQALAPGGLLIYETFAVGQERYGRPRNPDFLLKPGELLALVAGQARVIAYEDITTAGDPPACVQRICARREPADPSAS